MSALENDYARFMEWLRLAEPAEDVSRVAKIVNSNLQTIAGTSSAGGQRARLLSPLLRSGLRVTDAVIPPANERASLGPLAWTSLHKLTVGPFRGFRRPEEFDLRKRVVLFYGPNGSGKTSLCEAIELALLGEVEEASAKRIDSIDNYCDNIHEGRHVRPLRGMQADPLVRLQLVGVEPDTDALLIQRNAEVYAGGEEVLINHEVMDVYQRVMGAGKLVVVPSNFRLKLKAMISSLCEQSARITIREQGDGLLCFQFHHEAREQLVTWRLIDSHVIFSSVVLDSHATQVLAQNGKTMSACPLVTHTLKRNLEFDLVDFHVDQRGQLAVRACHPVVHFNSEELAFITTSVAAEADRLEQILLGLIGSD